MRFAPLCLACAWVLIGSTTRAAEPTTRPLKAEEFPISYWVGPPADKATIDAYRAIKDLNFTVANIGNGRASNIKELDLCRQVGLKALVSDPPDVSPNVSDEKFRAQVASIVAAYKDQPAMWGYLLRDEPATPDFPALRRGTDELLRQDPAHTVFINLFPTYATPDQLGAKNYANYLEAYFKAVNPPFISYDHYAILPNDQKRGDYFQNLELVRQSALKHGVPAWDGILSYAHLSYPEPNEAQMRWQVYTSLAAGMKGYYWFTLWPVKGLGIDHAIVDADGKPAPLYPIVKRLNGEVRALAPTLLKLQSTGVYFTGNPPAGCAKLEPRALLKLPNDQRVMVGFFTDNHQSSYAMVVNLNDTAETEFDLRAAPSVQGISVIDAADGLEHPIERADGAWRLRLLPGGGKLLRLATGRPTTRPAAAPSSKSPDVLSDPPRQSFLIVPLNVHLLQSDTHSELACQLSDDDVERVIRRMNGIWHRAGIHFGLTSVTREPAANVDAFTEQREADRAHAGVPSLSAFLRVVPEASRKLPGLHVYYIHEFEVNGVYMGGANVCFVKDAARLRKVEGGINEPLPRVTGHELGHALGLRHREDTTNLMASGTNGTLLNEAEVAIARERARHMNGAMTIEECERELAAATDRGDSMRATQVETWLKQIPVER